MENFRSVADILSMDIKEDVERQCHKNVALSAVVCIAAGIMLMMNIMRRSTLMSITSVILVGGFFITGILAGVFRMIKASSVIMATLLTCVFTVFVFSGGNEGFAVLWILLIPLFSISLFGMKIGIGMNIYFTVLVVTLFYTPLRSSIAHLYTSNFMARFPVLFIADVAISMYMSFSSEYYYRKTRINSYTDYMTGIFNRKYFMETIGDPDRQKPGMCICVIDVNGLKETNDNLGHAAGDELLCAVPDFAFMAFGKDAVVSRMGGDEFAVLAYGNIESVLEKARKMKEYALQHKGKFVNEVYLSVGIAALSEDPGLSSEELYRKADRLMYDDKSAFYRQKGRDRRQRS